MTDTKRGGEGPIEPQDHHAMTPADEPAPDIGADDQPAEGDAVEGNADGGADEASDEAADKVEDAALGEADPVAALEAQVSELKDQLLRTMAETENVRKRAQRDLQDANKYAASGFARDVLAVSDNLQRALEYFTDEMGAADEQVKNLGEGVEMTQRALEAALERHGIVRLEPVGEPFDHNFHQAMFEVETDHHAPGTVVQVVQAGYRIHDRLLRPAMVGVAKKPAGAAVDTDV